MINGHRHRYGLVTVALIALAGLGPIQIAQADSDIDSALDTLDDTDRSLRQDALKDALFGPLETRRHWSNIDSGYDGTFKATSDKPDGEGRICRTIDEILRSGGRRALGTTIACRSVASDRWQITRSSMAPFTPVPADLEPGDGISNTPIGQVPVTLPSSAGASGSVPLQVWIDGENYQRHGTRANAPSQSTASSPGMP